MLGYLNQRTYSLPGLIQSQSQSKIPVPKKKREFKFTMPTKKSCTKMSPPIYTKKNRKQKREKKETNKS